MGEGSSSFMRMDPHPRPMRAHTAWCCAADRMQRRETDSGEPAGKPTLAERQARRQEVMDIDDKRDDTGLFVNVAIALLGPAAIGLAIAYFSGYLDKLAAFY